MIDTNIGASSPGRGERGSFALVMLEMEFYKQSDVTMKSGALASFDRETASGDIESCANPLGL